MDQDNNRLEEIYRLERENNKILRSMRRNAFWGGLVKIILYLALLGIPIWLYFTYLFPVFEQFNNTVSAVTGRKVQMENQFAGWAETSKQYQEYFKGASSSPER